MQMQEYPIPTEILLLLPYSTNYINKNHFSIRKCIIVEDWIVFLLRHKVMIVLSVD